MKIYDTKGNELTERPDYEKGRILQDPNDPDRYIYTTWEELPAGDGNGETPRSKDQKLADLDAQYASDKAELTREYGDAVMHDDAETANALKAELAALDEWYDTEYRKIEGEE
ncbi:MAG: hypothetical protein IJ741_06920 [Schwartzia sp.]|nr:hypothetical protein [Schwartzia sp. (in: firmicutes)]